MNKNSLLKVVEICGGQVALAAILATDEYPIKQAHVWGWLNKNTDGIPAIHVIKACQCVNWQVTPHELRPDIYPHPEDGLPNDMRCMCKDKAA
jgi:DNA-binding transcriptional regulator YdaS (Cro superfamily)